MKFGLVFCVFVLLSTLEAFAQVDSLRFENGSLILGQIESLEKGIITLETDFDDEDFKIQWSEVQEIHTETLLYITLKGGEHLYGVLQSKGDSLVEIITRDGKTRDVKKDLIVVLRPLKSGFKDRFEAEIDIGLGLARSANLKQFNTSNRISYQTDQWKSHFSYSRMISSQDSSETIRRTESEIVLQYILHDDWYLVPSGKHLSNTEQNLKYRWNAQIGVGNFIVRTNKGSWGVLIGFNRNMERFLNEDSGKSSWEGLVGTSVDLFDLKDFELLTDVNVYPGITEKKRWRIDWNFKVKYDLPLDFYVKAELAINYDNQITAGAKELDYVSNLGFGWEW